MISDPTFYLFAIPAVLIVGLSKSGFGGSIGVLGVPLMAMVISPVQAAAIMLPILIAMDAVGVVSYRRIFDKTTLKIMIPAGIVGIGIGWASAHYFNDDMVRLLVGLIAVLFVANTMRKPAAERNKAAPHNVPKGAVSGMLAGFTSFLAHAGGPPFQFYTMPLRMEPRLFAGTSVIFFAVVNFIKLVPYFLLGQFSVQNLETSAVLLPLAPLSMLFGIWLVKRIPIGPFYTMTYIFVGISGLKLIWDGLSDLL